MIARALFTCLCALCLSSFDADAQAAPWEVGATMASPRFDRVIPFEAAPSAASPRLLDETTSGDEVEDARAPFDEAAWLVRRAVDYDCRLAAGEALRLEVAPENKGVLASGPCQPLHEAAVSLLDAAPGWLHAPLRRKLAALDEPAIAALDDLVRHLADGRLLDEVLFLASALPAEQLMDPQTSLDLLRRNAQAIYDADARLAFVELVEHDDADGAWTTARYALTEDGDELSWELPREAYYWYVVHPRIDSEPVGFVSPTSGAVTGPEAGVFWREDIWAPRADVPDYARHFVYAQPRSLSDEEMTGALAETAGYYEPFDVGPLVLSEGPDGRPSTIEFRLDGGTVLATQLPVDRDGGPLLENLARYGNGNVQATPYSAHTVLRDVAAPQSPSIEEILADAGIEADLVGAVDFAGLDLSQVDRIIVAGSQPEALYAAVSARREEIEARVREGMMFQLHGAAAAGDDWCGLLMPGGFTCGGLDQGTGEAQREGGQPHLGSLVEETAHVWDGLPGELSGQRAFAPHGHALDQVSFFTGQNLFDNVAEWRDKHPGLIPERSPHVARVLRNHFGNCGELQDVLGAASKALLLPASGVSNHAEDHVWTELFLLDRWVPFQVSWSDGPVTLDQTTLAMEKLQGGGKDISFVTRHRGDGALENVTGTYSETLRATVVVRDAEERPVDGALVLFASESWSDPDSLTLTFWTVTDLQGRAEVALGDLQNHYLAVRHELGDYPADQRAVALAIPEADATAGAEIELPVRLEGVAEAPGARFDPPPAAPDDDLSGAPVRIQVWNEGLEIEARNLYTDERYTTALAPRVGLDLLRVEPGALEDLKAGEPFDASAALLDVGDVDVTLASGGAERYHLVVRPRHDAVSFRHGLRLRLSFLAPAAPLVEADAVEDRDTLAGADAVGAAPTPSGGGGGCAVGARAPATTASLLLLAASALVASRRRRAGAGGR